MEEDNQIENNLDLDNQNEDLEGKEDLNLEDNQEGIDLDNGEEGDIGEGEEYEDDEENLEIEIKKKNGDWGLGIGDWGLGIGDWAQSPIPNPQSPFILINRFHKII